MRYALESTVAPASEPITRAQAKAWCRVDSDFTADDGLFDDLIEEARTACEDWLNQSLITQTWRMTLDRFPLDWSDGAARAGWRDWSAEGMLGWREITVPRPPLQSVTSITYVDTAGATQTLDPTLYQVDARRMPGRILPAYGAIWPVTRWQADAVTVTFVAGYGSSGSAVPATIKKAIKLLVADGYEQREQTIVGTISSELPTGVERLLSLAAHGSYE